ncbi:hypothetical protein BMS3Abin14_01954 [bacterium BMS3Abin14]|nr:hypothetical protein BMS3Abin14_01954 [bacterium BMS3Abin14]
MPVNGQKHAKRKFLEGMGCLLYLVAVALLAGVFLAHCGEVFR